MYSNSREFKTRSWKRGVTATESGAHAGCGEVSLVLAERPDLAQMDQAQQGFVGDFVGAMQKIPAGAAGFAMRAGDARV
jgi:creatinine amidohydrolase/Fe(II)-dependent formamide hydrolase-like protein